MRAFRLIGIALISNSWSIAYAQANNCQDGNAALQKKNYSLAVSRLNTCLSLNLTDKSRATMLMVRAQAYGGLKQLEFAIEDQEEAIALVKSRDAWPWIGLAIFRREMKQYDKALVLIMDGHSTAARLPTKPIS